FIEAEKDTVSGEGEKKYTITAMCAWLNVSKSGYYEWRSRGESATARRRAYLAVLIKEIFVASDETYGYRRIHAQLARQNEQCTPALVRRSVRGSSVGPCPPGPWRQSLPAPPAHLLPDLLKRDFTADNPGHKMVGDITYIPTLEGWVYLATVIDCH